MAVGKVRVGGRWVNSADLDARQDGAAEAERRGQYAPPRDAVTGEPLSASALYRITVQNDADPRPLPARMHVAKPTPCRSSSPKARSYWHGGPDWAPEFMRYIGDEMPADVAAEREQRANWWLHPYAVKIVRAQMGDRVANAILAWKGDDKHWPKPYAVVTSRYAPKRRAGWLDHVFRQATRLVHAEVFDAPSEPAKAA